jgi:hypothetical protein
MLVYFQEKTLDENNRDVIRVDQTRRLLLYFVYSSYAEVICRFYILCSTGLFSGPENCLLPTMVKLMASA